MNRLQRVVWPVAVSIYTAGSVPAGLGPSETPASPCPHREEVPAFTRGTEQAAFVFLGVLNQQRCFTLQTEHSKRQGGVWYASPGL